MKKLTIALSLLFLLSVTTAALAGSVTINYGGENGTVQINTQTPGYVDNFSMSSGGDFSGYHGVTAYSLSREAQFSGGGDIYAATYASDFMVGIAVEGSTGYLRQNVDVSSSLYTNFLATASGCSYLIDSYVGDSSLGLGMNLTGDGSGKLGGDFSLYNTTLEADVYALGDGSGTFGLYAFAPYLDFGANIWADSLYTSVYMVAYNAWLDLYATFDSYLEGYGYVGP